MKVLITQNPQNPDQSTVSRTQRQKQARAACTPALRRQSLLIYKVYSVRCRHYIAANYCEVI